MFVHTQCASNLQQNYKVHFLWSVAKTHHVIGFFFYSIQGSTYCFNLPPCTSSDLLNHLDTIDQCYADNSKVPLQWVRKEWAEWQHHYGYNRPFCEPQSQSPALLNHTVLCRCQPGQQFIALQIPHTSVRNGENAQLHWHRYLTHRWRKTCMLSSNGIDSLLYDTKSIALMYLCFDI